MSAVAQKRTGTIRRDLSIGKIPKPGFTAESQVWEAKTLLNELIRLPATLTKHRFWPGTCSLP